MRVESSAVSKLSFTFVRQSGDVELVLLGVYVDRAG